MLVLLKLSGVGGIADRGRPCERAGWPAAASAIHSVGLPSPRACNRQRSRIATSPHAEKATGARELNGLKESNMKLNLAYASRSCGKDRRRTPSVGVTSFGECGQIKLPCHKAGVPRNQNDRWIRHGTMWRSGKAPAVAISLALPSPGRSVSWGVEASLRD